MLLMHTHAHTHTQVPSEQCLRLPALRGRDSGLLPPGPAPWLFEKTVTQMAVLLLLNCAAVPLGMCPRHWHCRMLRS